MTRKKQLILAMLLAVLLVGLALTAGISRPREAVTAIVSLRRAVKAGTVLGLDDLTLVSLPDRLVDSAYLRLMTDAVGRAPIHDLSAGQLVLRGWLRERPDGVAYPDAAAGSRLYTLNLRPEQANGFWLAAGNRVDVHLIPRGDGLSRNVSAMLPEMLPGVRIAALIGGSEPSGSSVLASGQSTGLPLVCLAVSAAEARILALAEPSYLIKLVPLNEPLGVSLPDLGGTGSAGAGLALVEASAP